MCFRRILLPMLKTRLIALLLLIAGAGIGWFVYSTEQSHTVITEIPESISMNGTTTPATTTTKVICDHHSIKHFSHCQQSPFVQTSLVAIHKDSKNTPTINYDLGMKPLS